MTRRVSITEIVKATGLSRATVDRALHGRQGVHPRTESVVEEAIKQLRGSRPQRAEPRPAEAGAVDAILRLGSGLAELCVTAIEELALPIAMQDMQRRDEDAVLEAVQLACRDVTRPLIVTAKASEPMREVLTAARRRGKRIIALVSDLPVDARDAFVGIDNRAAGQTAAYLVSNHLQGRTEATVGVVLGDYAFKCHEDREIGFRSFMRAYVPYVRVADAAKGEDIAEQTREAVGQLLEEHPNIAAIYNVAGGSVGLVAALEEAGMTGKVCVVGHEANFITVPFIRRDAITYLLAQSPAELLQNALRLARESDLAAVREQHHVDFGVYTRFNLPQYGVAAAERRSQP